MKKYFKLNYYVLTLLALTAAPALADPTGYIRADIGYSKPSKLKDANYNFTAANGTIGSINFYGTGKLKASANFTLGAGAALNKYSRSDLTYSYLAGYKYRDSGSDPQGSYSINQKISVNNIMWNGYLELPNPSFATPYLMAGVGMAHIKPQNYSDVYVSTVNPSTNFSHTGSTKSNLSWAVGVGAALHLMNGIYVDLGYKHINLGKITTIVDPNYITWATGQSAANKNSVPSQFSSKLNANEITLGVRYEF